MTGFGPPQQERWRRRRRVAFKLVAVAVVLGVAWCGYTVYELLAETRRREKGYRALQQLGGGLYGYNKYEGSFPPGTSLVPGQPPEKGHSWMVHILPYMEQ